MNKNNPIIFIPGHVPSLKNTHVIASFKKKGQSKSVYTLVHHQRVREYIAKTNWHYEEKAARFYQCYQSGTDLLGEPMYSYPVRVGLHFVRVDNRKFDFHNATHIVADMMVKHNWIPDDDIDHFLPFPLYLTPKKFNFTCSWYSVYKNGPGVAIKVL